MNKNFFNKPQYALFPVVLISIFIILLQQGEINRDGILYITQAHYIFQGNWNQVFELYNWPFFSYLIFLIQKFTDLPFLYSAHAVDLILFFIAAYFFFKILLQIYDKNNPLVFGVIIILTSIPLMDDYVGMILRDHGQWSGFMIGVYFYLRWLNKKTFFNASLWQLGFLFGALFRLECLLFNLIIPFSHQIIFEKKFSPRIFFQSISFFCTFILIFFSFYFFSESSLHSFNLSRINELVEKPKSFLLNFSNPLGFDTDDFMLKVLLYDYGLSFKYIFLCYVALYKWISGLGLFHLFLFFYCLKKRIVSLHNSKVLLFFFLISTIITVVNLFTTYIIANRYWVMNWWIVYIFSSIGLCHIWYGLNDKNNLNKKYFRYIIVLFIIIHFFIVLIDKPGKHFEKQAGDWIKNEKIDVNNVYFNSKRTAFYAGLLGVEFADIEYATDVIMYDYLVIRFNRFDNFRSFDEYKMIKHFPSINNPKVIIYKRITHD